MVEAFLILLGIGVLIYKIAYEVPKDIKKLESKIDMLKLHIQQIDNKLNEIDKKLDQNNE